MGMKESIPNRQYTDEFKVEAENARLRRELASTKEDLDIGKNAAAYFARESR